VTKKTKRQYQEEKMKHEVEQKALLEDLGVKINQEENAEHVDLARHPSQAKMKTPRGTQYMSVSSNPSTPNASSPTASRQDGLITPSTPRNLDYDPSQISPDTPM